VFISNLLEIYLTASLQRAAMNDHEEQAII
jgi:hypothetical protein